MHTTKAVVKLKPEENSGLNGIRTASYQLSYQTDWELATLSYEVIGFQTRELGPDNMANFSPASETNLLKIKLSITWRGIQPGAQFSPG